MDDSSAGIFECQANICSVFSNDKRLMILWLIGEGEKSVGAIAKEAGLSDVAVSQHLRVMKDRGVVVSRKEGRSVLYRIANPKFLRGIQLIREGLVEESAKRNRTLQDNLR